MNNICRSFVLPHTRERLFMDATYFALNCYMSRYCFIKASQIPDHLDDPFHIYFVLSEPKAYFIEPTIRISNRELCCQIERNGETLPLDRVLLPELDGGTITVVSKTLSRDKSTLTINCLRDFQRRETFVITANDAYKASGLCTKLNYDVLYIGQSFGGDGHRTAGIRLQNHSTLQRIQSDIADKGSDVELVCLLTDFELDTMLVAPPNKDEEYAMDKLRDFFMSHRKWRKNQWIDVAEAGLIYFFQPPYNTEYVKSVYKKPDKDGTSKFAYLYSNRIDRVLIEFTPDVMEASIINGIVIFPPHICLKTDNAILDTSLAKHTVTCCLNSEGVVSVNVAT